MKKKINGIVCLMSAMVIVAFMSSSAKAIPIVVNPSVPITMFDGGDLGSDVSVVIQDNTPGYILGYMDGGFQGLLFVYGLAFRSFVGGTSVDFAISDGVNLYTLSGGDAVLTFSGLADPDPTVSIDWGFARYDILLTVSNGDGFAPYYANGNPTGNSVVPEPSTLVLLGSGLVGLSLWRRKKTSRA